MDNQPLLNRMEVMRSFETEQILNLMRVDLLPASAFLENLIAG